MTDREFVEELEKKLGEIGDLFRDYYDLCMMRGESCLGGEVNPCCYNSRFPRADKNDKRCLYLTESGCGHPNGECKMWFCGHVVKNIRGSRIFEALLGLEKVGKLYGIGRSPFLSDEYIPPDRAVFKC